MLGLKLENGGESYEVTPNLMGVREIFAKVPTKKGWLEINVVDGNVNVKELESGC
jgi:hypothetical protein